LELAALRIDWLGRDLERDEARLSSPNYTGTVFIDATFVGAKPFWDPASLRARVPTARFGNLLMYQGPCSCAEVFAGDLYGLALPKIFAEKPDLQAGQRLLRESASLDPTVFFVWIELGNVSRQLGSRDDALQAYSNALRYAPAEDTELRRSLQQQIQRISIEPLDRIPDLRDPFLE
jgi:tetratricopeptide (TPR) repeat protein